MKKYTKRILLFLFIALIGFMASRLIRKAGRKEKARAEIKQLPDFSFRGTDSIPFTSAMLRKGSPVVFIYFNTECEHCQYEADEITRNIDHFAQSTVLMISREPRERLKAFDERYGLTRHPQIKVLQDDQDQFYRLFATNMVPVVFIYDGQGKLVQQYQGEVKMSAIYKYL